MELNYRQQVTFMGMLAGAAIGMVGATIWLDHLSGREIPENKSTKIGYGDLARFATATIALVRQVNELTREKDDAA